MTLQHFGKEYGSNASENYERFFVPAIGAPLARDLMDYAMIQPGERVFDVACGTGIVARLALEQADDIGSVVGLDINPGMLAVARAVSPPQIDWYEASMENIPLQDNLFDVVLCQASLMFVPDKQKALNEMYRVLAPGGRVLVNAPGPASHIWKALIETFNKFIGPEAAGFIKRVFYLHNADEMRQLMISAGFNNITITKYIKKFKLPASKDFLWQYVKSTPLGAMLSDADEDTLSELENEIVGRWSGFEEEGNLSDQLSIMVASAHKVA